ncbi:uncharacterized protein LOC129741727 [Uranotaenia lowii]|uniref:uncharacterized protein LOC129741727 n=1 Tax=Uranotaenia lowii TaxID=190385 RepID=UPI00247A28EB|nr:uncharacterized protein LOC129741727 [Uranotaenia lowii]
MCALDSPTTMLKTVIASLHMSSKYVPYYFPALSKLKELMLSQVRIHEHPGHQTIDSNLVGNPIGLANILESRPEPIRPTDSLPEMSGEVLHYGCFAGQHHAVVPTRCAKFRYELAHTIDWALKDRFVNLMHSKHFENQGHFSAMQLPAVLTKNFIELVKKFENVNL